jgi:hypothetical protein
MTTISGLVVRAAVAATVLGGAMAPGPAAAQERAVTVNRVRLGDQQVAQLERLYRVRVADGRYWYDARSGAWGVWGGPALGVMHPGLALGAPLPASASGGGSGGVTGVFVNGRELHPLDVMALRQITPVVLPGRYWVDASGTGGREGGPAYFNLYAMAAQARAAGRGGRSWIHNGPGGGMGGDGDCVYYISADASAMTGC